MIAGVGGTSPRVSAASPAASPPVASASPRVPAERSVPLAEKPVRRITRRPDVLVVGGGPAGSTVAGLLARRGWTVELLERRVFPRAKACGECLNPGAVRALRRLDLMAAVEALEPVRLQGWDLLGVPATPGAPGAPGATAATGVGGRFGPEVGPALAVDRSRLDHALLKEAARRGAQVRQGVRVTAVEGWGRARPEGSLSGETDGGRPPRARVVARGPDGELTLYPRVVLGADGLRSRVARALGATRRLPRLGKVSFTFHVRGRGPSPDVGRLRLDAPPITLGLAPLAPPDEQGRAIWNATLVATTTSRRSRTPGRDEVERLLRDPAGALQDALGRVDLRWGEPPEIVGGPWASGPFDWPTDPAPAPGVLLLGDAAGYFDPLTGQGMYRALRSAELAATAAERILRGDGKGERRRYARALRSAFGPGRRVQRAVESVLARDRVRRPILRLLGRRPGALSHLIEVTGDARPARALMGAHFLGALLRTAAHEG